jgi:hypothetical protein
MRSGQFEDVASLSDLSYRVGASHNVGLNYGNIRDTRRTIEYRYFDSSLDPVDTCMLFSPSTSTTTTSIAHTGASVFRARCHEAQLAMEPWSGDRLLGDLHHVYAMAA